MDAALPETIVPVRLGPDDAGEVWTLQRAAFVTEAIAYDVVDMPPLTESLDDVKAEQADPAVLAHGLRDGHRLVAALRVRLSSDRCSAELRRVSVAPDRYGEGLATRLIVHALEQLPKSVHQVELLTGPTSERNLALYTRLGFDEAGHVRVEGITLVRMVATRPFSTGQIPS